MLSDEDAVLKVAYDNKSGEKKSRGYSLPRHERCRDAAQQ